MIKGLHGIFYTTDPEGARAFLRDKLGFPHIDAGDGWLIFNLPEGHIGCHPSDSVFQGISVASDDIETTIKELAGRGVALTPIVEEDWGRTTTFELPGGGPVMIYQAKYG